MKPFDLELAKAGHTVCTRDGCDVRIVSFDGKYTHPVIGVITMKNHVEHVQIWTNSGHIFNDDNDRDYDLFMKEEEEKEKKYFVLYNDQNNTFLGGIGSSLEITKLDPHFKRLGYKIAEITIKRIIDSDPSVRQFAVLSQYLGS